MELDQLRYLEREQSANVLNQTTLDELIDELFP